jgi:hypothetical protein
MESRRRKQTEEPPVEERAVDLVRDEVDGDLRDGDIEEGKRAHDDDDDDSLGRPVRLNR